MTRETRTMLAIAVVNCCLTIGLISAVISLPHIDGALPKTNDVEREHSAKDTLVHNENPLAEKLESIGKHPGSGSRGEKLQAGSEDGNGILQNDEESDGEKLHHLEYNRAKRTVDGDDIQSNGRQTKSVSDLWREARENQPYPDYSGVITSDMLRGGPGGAANGTLGGPTLRYNGAGDWTYTYVETFNASRPGSCRLSCGVRAVVPCSCDLACFVYKTCCEDVSTYCPSLEQEAKDFFGNALVDARPEAIACHASGFLVVNGCPDEKADSEIRQEDENDNNDNELFEDFIAATRNKAVVFDNVTGILYRDRSVYKCYHSNVDVNTPETETDMEEQDSLLPWRFFYYDVMANKKSKRFYFDPTNATNAFVAIDPKHAVFLPQSRDIVGHPCTSNARNTCDAKYKDMDPENKCGKFLSYFQEVPGETPYPFIDIYSNRYCFYCATNKTEGTHLRSVTVAVDPPKGVLLTGHLRENNTMEARVKGLHLIGVWVHSECKYNEDVLESNLNGTVSKSNSKSKSSPKNAQKSFCTILECAKSGMIIDDVCQRQHEVKMVLPYPPKVERTIFEILDITSFITCFLDDKTWLTLNGGEVTSVLTVGAADSSVGLTPLMSDNQNFSEYTPYVDDPESYFSMKFTAYSKEMVFGQSVLSAVKDAVQYWYIRKKAVITLGNGLLLFKNHDGNMSESDYLSESNEHNFETVLRNPLAFLHHIIPMGATEFRSGVRPIEVSVFGKGDRDQLDICFNDVTNGVQGHGGGDETGGDISGAARALGACWCVWLVVWVLAVAW